MDKISLHGIDYYRDILYEPHNCFNSSTRITKSNYELIDELFKIMGNVKANKNLCRTLFLWKERGSLEDNFDIKECIENGEVNSKEELEEYFYEEYPKPVKWFEFTTREEVVNNVLYRLIFLNNKAIIYLDSSNTAKESFGLDVSDLLEWLIDSAKQCIEMLKNGTYNEFVRKNIDNDLKYGKLLRKDFFDLWPEERESYFENLSEEEIIEFCNYVKEQPKNATEVKGLKKVCAHDFYSACALGYKENNYDGLDKTPKEQYYMHADGRDDGLSNIDEYSCDAYEYWLDNPDFNGAHPWEVCRGGNSTHISLQLCKARGLKEKGDGYIYILLGKAYSRTIETIKFYLALKRNGLPVYLYDAEQLALRVQEKDYIGIVPTGIFPRYCEDYFPGEEIIDFMNLPYENREEFAKRIDWYPIETVELNDN